MESLDRTAARTAPSDLFRELSKRDGLARRWLVLSFVVASIAIFCRCPGLLTHAQFYAEDGPLFFAQAYNLGWLHSLGIPYGGYLTILQRIAGGAALLAPFRWAPFVMTLWGLLIQALPVPVLLSWRLRGWAPLPVRLAFAAVYVGIPNAREIHVVCTNSQWHLAVVLALLVFAEAAETLFAKVFDVLLVSIAALTGPFGIAILPVAAIFWYVRRQRWTMALLGILSVGSIIQIVMVLRHYADRHQAPLGATAALFVRLLGGNGFIGALLGSRLFGLGLPLAASAFMLVIGITLCVYCAMSLRAGVRLFFIYCFAIYAAGMRSPMIGFTDAPSWPVLLQIPSQRYLFFPSLALLFSILWCAAFARLRIIRGTAIALMLVLFVGIYRDWKIPPLTPVDASKQVRAFEEAKPGERVVIPIYPPGWDMALIKR